MDSKFRKFFRQYDKFGRKVELNYKNENTYKSACGGFVSLVV